MDNPLGVLNHVKHAFGVEDAYYATRFDVNVDDVELQVVVRDAGVPAGPQRYVVTILRDDKVLAEAGPEADLPTTLRNAYSKAKSHF